MCEAPLSERQMRAAASQQHDYSIKIERIAVSYLHPRAAGPRDACSECWRPDPLLVFGYFKNGTRLVESDRVLKRGRVCYDREIMTGS